MGARGRRLAAVAIVGLGILLAPATAGARTPPDYSGGTGFLNRMVCPVPDASLRQEATNLATKAGPIKLDAADLPRRVLVVGDSAACSLTIGLRAYGEPYGMSFRDISVIGCGAAAGQLYSKTEDFPNHSEGCHDQMTGLMRAASAKPTDVIIWLSTWERDDQVVDGKLVKLQSDAGRRLARKQLERRYRLLRQGTAAPLVLLTIAAPATADQVDGQRQGNRVDDRRYARVNRILETFAAKHPYDVVVIDLAHKMCPKGPPCGSVHGFNPRSGDGRHLTTDGAVWAARWLLPKLASLPTQG